MVTDFFIVQEIVAIIIRLKHWIQACEIVGQEQPLVQGFLSRSADISPEGKELSHLHACLRLQFFQGGQLPQQGRGDPAFHYRARRAFFAVSSRGIKSNTILFHLI